MRAAVFSTVCASVTFFAPGVDVRPAPGFLQAAVQPALQPQFPEFVVSAAPQVVVATSSARTAGSADDASVRWFAYGVFGALCTVALRSAARAAPSVPRPAARIHPLRMSAAVAEKEDAAWGLARDAIASRTRTGYW